MAGIRTVLFDFDGTLTSVDQVAEAFLIAYRDCFLNEVGLHAAPIWDAHIDALKEGSPSLAWMLSGFEACPVDADPYILASEAATRTLASLGATDAFRGLSNRLYQQLYQDFAAPFRPETTEVLGTLIDQDIKVAVVSNASTGKIEARLDKLLPSALRSKVQVYGDASKFLVCPATEEGPLRARFDALPTLVTGPGRPAWVKRGRFFDALVRGFQGRQPEEVLFVGDIYELDLILPLRLGCAVQLISREGILSTHDYERQAVLTTSPIAFSRNLSAVLRRV